MSDENLDQLVEQWLAAKFARSQSQQTLVQYRATMRYFRAELARHGFDLADDPRRVADIIEPFVERSWVSDELVSARTRNNRITNLSSFYRFAIQRGVLIANPTNLLERRPETTRHAALPFEPDVAKAKLAAIDCRTLRGFRDYMLLLLAFMTGRRRSEIAGLRRGHICQEADHLVVTWVRCKGGKVMRDDLQGALRDAMHLYLAQIDALYQQELLKCLAVVFFVRLPIELKQALCEALVRALPALWDDLPVWPSFLGGYLLQPLQPRALGNIAKRHLGTSKFHTTRHTFSIMMEEAGAKLAEIGTRLGHDNPQTTGLYLIRLHSARNPYAAEIASLLDVQPGGWEPPQWRDGRNSRYAH